MRFSSVVLLLVATALLANGERMLDSDSATARHFFSAARSGHHETPSVARYLRGGKATSTEERGFSFLAEQAKSVGTKIKDTFQFGKWLANGQSADDVFALLKLDDGLDNLLGNPKFKSWARYIEYFNKQHPEEQVTMAGLLTKRYGDEALAKMLEVAVRVPSQTQTATTLAKQQRELWQKAKDTVGDVFTLLKLDKVDDVFDTQHTNAWYKYAYDVKANDAGSMMLSVLAARYGDDGLVKILSSTKHRQVEYIATQLREVRENQWVRQKLTTDEVFKLLKLDDDAKKLLANPVLDSWTSYLERLNKRVDKEAAMAKTFTKFYGDDVVSKMIVAAKKGSSTEELASRLQNAQFKQWLSGEKSADDVFKLLKLDNDANKLLTNPVFDTWSSFLVQRGGKNIDTEAEMLKTFTKFYSDDVVSTMIAAAKAVPSTEKLATRLQNAQFKQWLSGEKSTESVFKLLKLDDNLNNLLVNPNLAVWMRYADEFDLKNPGQGKTMMETLTWVYGNEGLSKALEAAKKVSTTMETAKKLQTAQFEMWLKNRVKPSHIWSMLKMEKATWMTNPNAGVWREYSAFYKLNKPQ